MPLRRFPTFRTLSVRATAGGALAGMIISLLFFAAHSSGPVQASTRSAPLWPNWDIARGVVTGGGGNSGYVLDGFGGLHPFSLAGRPPDPVTLTGYWRGWDIARGVTLRADGRSGYVLDGRGGLHPFGVAGDMPPAVTVTARWPADMARGVALRADGHSGYVLDAWGRLYPFGIAGHIPPAPQLTAYWKGWDIARSVALVPGTDSGYVLDGWGRTHPFNPGPSAPILATAGDSPGVDLARGLVVDNTGSAYLVSDTAYLVSMRLSLPSTSERIPIAAHARGISFGTARGTDGVVVDAYGAVTPVQRRGGPTPAPSVAPTPPPPTGIATPTPIAVPSSSPSRSSSPSPTLRPLKGQLSIRIVGAHFVDGNGNTVRLIGTTRPGTQYSCVKGFFEDGPWGQSTVDAMAAWHMNAVRVPLNEDCWLGINGLPGNGYTATQYRADVHAFVSEFHNDGMYVVLDNRVAAPGSIPASGQASSAAEMADADHSPAFLSSLAASFRSDPAVIFDLYNEPNHLPGLADGMACVRNGCTVTDTAGLGTYQAAGEQTLLDAVRAAGATQVVLESTPSYGGDARYWLQYVLSDPLHQVGASVHPYESAWWLQTPLEWSQQLGGIIAAGYPVFATETGPNACGSAAYITSQMAWFDANGVSYMPFGWNGFARCGQTLNANWTGAPYASAFALAVYQHLLSLP